MRSVSFIFRLCSPVKRKGMFNVPFKVESDWSAASYWYQIATLSPEAEIELVGLFHNSYQGDFIPFQY